MQSRLQLPLWQPCQFVKHTSRPQDLAKAQPSAEKIIMFQSYQYYKNVVYIH